MIMKKTIGFFGDSFCSTITDKFSNTSETYIKKLIDWYDLSVVNLGVSGSSIGDLFLLQFKKILDQNIFPDIMIFVWTQSNRLFNRQIRNITFGGAARNKTKNEIYGAASQYYKILYDSEWHDVQYLAMLQYIDNNFLINVPADKKIIHMWTYGITPSNAITLTPEIVKYPYKWKSGVEIRPSLGCLSLMNYPPEKLINDDRPNHLEGEFKNNLLFETIKNSIDNYSTGTIVNYSF